MLSDEAMDISQALVAFLAFASLKPLIVTQTLEVTPFSWDAPIEAKAQEEEKEEEDEPGRRGWIIF